VANGQDLLLVPSTNASPSTLASIAGLDSWPERHLIELRHLQHPEHRMVMVTPVAISDACLDAVLQLMPAAPPHWVRQRLHCISLNDHSPRSLTSKLLARPRLLEHLATLLRPGAMLACYSVSAEEMILARRLGLELEGSPAELAELGSKAGSAEVFRATGLPHPRTTPLCHSIEALSEAIDELALRDPAIDRLVVKLNRMAGGRGNAPLALALEPWRQQRDSERRRQLQQALRQLAMPLPHWGAELERNGAIAQELICAPAGALSSPSVQIWIKRSGDSEILSTHEQCLGGVHGQSFQGCRFPARHAYAQEAMAMAERLGPYLAKLGCRGPVLLDLLARREPQGWRLWAIEINLRKGGTTHPFQLAATATGSVFDRSRGLLRTGDGEAVFYEASDAFQQEHWRGLLPEQMVDALVKQGLYFNSASRRGCIPMRLGALSEHGLLGAICVGRSRRDAARLMQQLQAVR
jgi:hypothetical protein